MMLHQSDEKEHVYCISDISISIQSFTIKYDFSYSFSLEALYQAFQVALVIKNPPANAGDARDSGSIPALGRSPGGGHDNPLQYSSLGNPVEREAWQATVHEVAKSRTRLKQLSTHAHTEYK